MQFITMCLTDGEWDKVRGVAQRYWPQSQLDRQLSRNEACRRLLMGGLAVVNRADADAAAQSVEQQPDRMTPQLPGAPKKFPR
jgi:hypothetical protein